MHLISEAIKGGIILYLYFRDPSPYSHMQDLNELDGLAEKIEYEKEEAFSNPHEGIQHLIAIYSRMLELNPDRNQRERIERVLLQLFMHEGWRYKGNQQYDAALAYFSQIIHQNPKLPMPRVHYRLGFIYDYKEDWLNAVHHFSKSLSDHQKMGGFGREDEEHPKLTKNQHLKASIQLVIISRKVSEQWISVAGDLYMQSENPDDETFDIAEKMEEVIRQTEDYPYIMHTRSEQKKWLTTIRYEEGLNEVGELYLDFVSLHNPCLRYNNKRCSITTDEKALIEFFMKNPRSNFKQDELKQDFRKKTDAIRKSISRLNVKCANQLTLPYRVINHTEYGYHWSSENYSIIIGSKDPANHMWD
jgi:tetratricopeptide (TPR) repeat protein